MTNRNAGADPARRPAAQGAVVTAYRFAILGGLLAMLGANLPGHLSLDSVVQLHEGRFGVRETWAPAIVSWLLGRFDHLVPGSGLYVTASGALLFGALLSLKELRPRLSWAAVLLAAGMALTPILLVYQGIVWKDVLFANLTVAGFVWLAHAARRWGETLGRWGPLLAALACFVLAMLVRQNGAVVVVFAAAALGWTARAGGLRRALAWGVGGFLAVALLAQAMGPLVQPAGSDLGGDTRKGLRVLLHYDVIGAMAHDPKLTPSLIAAADPQAAALMETEGRRYYSPQRIETFAAAPAMMKALWRQPDQLMIDQWRAVVLGDPAAYLKHRTDVFIWMLATPDIRRCVPLWTGVDGPPDKLAALKIPQVIEPQDATLYVYAERFFRTPLFSHLAYAAIALAVAAALMVRRDAADVVMAALLVSVLAFTASFFVISVACDYRYLYALDLAALTGLLYLAIDPSLKRRTATVA